MGGVYANEVNFRHKKSVRPVTIHELMGIAIGKIGMSLNDFKRLDSYEFAAIFNSYMEKQESEYKASWEQTRSLAYCIVKPYLKKEFQNKSSHDLYPLPWDKEKDKKEDKKDVPKLTAEEQRERMRKLAESLGDTMI